MNKSVVSPLLALGLMFGLMGCTPPAAESTPAAQSTTRVSVTSTPGAVAVATDSATPAVADALTPKSAPEAVKGSVPLEPFPGVTAPAIKKVVHSKFTTDAGEMLIDIYPEAGPNAAKRFQELIESGFYNNTPIFRVVPNFVAQFGINSDPKTIHFKNEPFKDDPSLFKLSKGTLAFAKSGPDTNATQIFIDYNDNSNLRQQGFTAFAAVVKGYDVATKFKAVGDPSMGLSQDSLWGDTQGYLKSLPEKPNMILKAEIIK
jgi:peptidyl-prolyl cis-trans isomerase A (cyclophilin A)